MSDSFIIYTSYLKIFEQLTDAQLGQLTRHMLSFAKTGKEPLIEDPLVKLSFAFIKDDMERNQRKYEEKCERLRANARKRWDKKQLDSEASEDMQKHTNVCKSMQMHANAQIAMHNDNDNEYVNDNVYDDDVSKETNILDEIYKFYYFSSKKIGFNQSLTNKIVFYNGYWKKSKYKDSLDEYSYLPIMNTDVNSRHCPGRTIGFYTNSSFVKLYYYGEGDKIEVRINGESSLIQLHNNSSSNWITIAEGLKGINKIEIIVKYRFTISGIEIESSSFITKNIVSDKKILFFGDSITNAGFGTSKPSLSFAYKIGEKLNMQSINQGIPGSKMHTDGLNRVDTDIVCDPNFIFILYGANDIGNSVSVEDFKSSYDLCIKNIKSKLLDCKIFIGTMIKRSDESSISLTFNSYQEAIKEVCKSNDCILIDTYEAIPDSSNIYYVDGIHPNDLGHEKISEFVANNIKKYI